MRARGGGLLAILLLLLSIVVGGALTGVESLSVSTKTSSEAVATDTFLSLEYPYDENYPRIFQFLKEHESSTGKVFHVQGWRWHTMSLLRDAKRLSTLASHLYESKNATIDDSLEKAVNHVVDFNMKALHRIETKTFFPWLKAQLTSAVGDDDGKLALEFSAVLDEVIQQQEMASEIGTQVTNLLETVYDSKASESSRLEAMRYIAELSNDLASRLEQTLKLEDVLLVPAVAILIPASQQKALNNRIILNLGVLDSRLHLVGMHEAVLEQGPEEQELFQKEIPAIPRYMIPRWKRLLYDPQASVLEVQSEQ